MRPTVLFYVWLRGWPIHAVGRASWLHVTVVVATRRDGIFKEGRGRDRGQDGGRDVDCIPPYSYIASSK